METVIDILKSLSPMEVLEALGLDEDPEELINNLEEYVEENYETIRITLISLGLIEEDENGVDD